MKPRVLLLAEAANPERVSVPLVGWSFFNALRQVADVHLVTQIRNQNAILRAGLVEGRDFTVIDTERLERPLHRISKALRLGWTSKTAFKAISYPYFERLVWARFENELVSGAYDIVHRVTPPSPPINSPIATRCAKAGIPFVLGPLNGGLPWPRGFDSTRRKEKEWLSYVRGAYKLLPRHDRMLKATSIILTGSHHTASEIPDVYRNRMIYLPENGIDSSRFHPVEKGERQHPVHACFVGRLVPYKGPDMLIEAAAPYLRTGDLHLDIVGDGPMMTELQAKIAMLGVSESVTVHGWVDHADVPGILGAADILTFPSIREFGGGVVLEAMALGVTPVVVDYGGPGELVEGGYGIAIPLGTRAQIIAHLSRALADIVADPERTCLPPDVLIRHVENEFSWQAKARKICQVYSDLMSSKARKNESLRNRI